MKNMLNLNKNILILAILILVFQLTFPQYSHAYGLNNSNLDVNNSILAFTNSLQPVLFSLEDKDAPRLIEAGERVSTRKMKVVITAYSSTVDQCDDTPFITANGSRVKDGIVAANFAGFGTKIKIPELFGDKVFSVEDRMNRRFNKRIDIWMPSREEAIKFGVKYAEVEIY